jgi:hypothetical protein
LLVVAVAEVITENQAKELVVVVVLGDTENYLQHYCQAQITQLR